MSLLGDHNRLLTGDCLLIGSCGRTDFQNGSTQDMYESLQKLLLLPPDTLVYPGHDYHKRFVSTFREEKEKNPQLQHKSFAHFKKDLESWNLAPPKKIKQSVPANLRGGSKPETF
jgi:sulfur dioxygenase